jgi:hypothetical protein
MNQSNRAEGGVTALFSKAPSISLDPLDTDVYYGIIRSEWSRVPGRRKDLMNDALTHLSGRQYAVRAYLRDGFRMVTSVRYIGRIRESGLFLTMDEGDARPERTRGPSVATPFPRVIPFQSAPIHANCVGRNRRSRIRIVILLTQPIESQ